MEIIELMLAAWWLAALIMIFIVVALLIADLAALTLFGKARAGALVARSCGIYLEKESAGTRAYHGVIPVLRAYRGAAFFAFLAVLIAASMILATLASDQGKIIKLAAVIAFLGIGASAGVAAFDLKSDKLHGRQWAAVAPTLGIAVATLGAKLYEKKSKLLAFSTYVDALKVASYSTLFVVPAVVTLLVVVTLEQRTRTLVLDAYERKMNDCGNAAKNSKGKDAFIVQDHIAQAAAPVELSSRQDNDDIMQATDVKLNDYSSSNVCEHFPHMHGREKPAAIAPFMATLRAHSDEVVEVMGSNAFGATAGLVLTVAMWGAMAWQMWEVVMKVY